VTRGTALKWTLISAGLAAAGAAMASLAEQPWDMVITAVAFLLTAAIVLFAAVAWSSGSSRS
jgi:hypothetical protein